MPDILLTHGYFLDEDEKERLVMKPYPPLGLMYLSAYLKRAGFSVDFYDSTLGSRTELITNFGAWSGGVVGIYTTLITRGSVISLTRAAKQNGCTVVLGGSEAINYPAEYLEYGADVIVIGEGEETVAELLTALASRGSHRLHGIAGIVFRDEDGRVVRTPARPQIADVDLLPWPDRSAVDIDDYMRIWRKHHGVGSVHMITARGCPYTCRWCSRAVYGSSHRRRSHLDCADELEMIGDTYGPEQVWYADDVFTISHRWLFDYAGELKRRGIRLPFETISRADRLMSDEVFATLADMGCYRIWIGSESGSQRILDAMDRRVTIEQVQWASHAARRHGIQVGIFLMWGYEGETEDDIEATIEHVKRAAPDVFLTTVCYPVRDTQHYQIVKDRLIPAKPWAESTDKDLLIAGRHSRNYYQQVSKWARADVDAYRLSSSDPVLANSKRDDANKARQTMATLASEVEA